jgi:glycosyltransferase involved in cell wall biosynthesis
MDFGGDLERELEAHDIPHAVMNRKGLEPAVFGRLYRFIRNNRIDVVHTHHFTQLFYAAIPARLAGARIVHTEHEFFSYTASAFSRALIRPMLPLCEQMTVVGPEVADYFVRTLGVPKRRVAVVPNGVDLDAFDYDARNARNDIGIDQDAPVVGTIGRLEPEKNQMTLLEVFRDLRASHPKTRLIIVGNGSMAEPLRAHAQKLGVADGTHFLGYRRDVARLLAAMDVFVLPSIREGLPISLIEAMAARRPVVASSIGSVNDLVTDGQNGFVAPPDRPAAFTDAIRKLLDAPDLRRRLADAGRQNVESSYSLASVVRAYEHLYRSSMKMSHVRN